MIHLPLLISVRKFGYFYAATVPYCPLYVLSRRNSKIIIAVVVQNFSRVPLTGRCLCFRTYLRRVYLGCSELSGNLQGKNNIYISISCGVSWPYISCVMISIYYNNHIQKFKVHGSYDYKVILYDVVSYLNNTILKNNMTKHTLIVLQKYTHISILMISSESSSNISIFSH